MEGILQKAQLQYNKQLPFVLYSKPNENRVKASFQSDDRLNELTDFDQKGFVFASFDGNKTYLIPENTSERFQEEVRSSTITFEQR